MGDFICKTLKCLLLLIITQISLLLSMVLIMDKMSTKAFILSKNQIVKDGMVFILGNSHPECAINDSLLPSNYGNIAESGEPLFYTVIKARRLLLSSGKIDTIVIEFTNNSLNTVKWVTNDSSVMRNYKKHFAVMSLSEHGFLFQNNPRKSIKTLFALTPRDIYLSKKIIDGRYLFLVKNNINGTCLSNRIGCSVNISQVKDKIKESEFRGYSNLLSLIKDYPTTFFVLTRMPMHKSYKGLGNEIQFQNCVKQLNKNKNCRFIDFLKSNLNDTDFGDAEHLNHFGASKFTPVFRDSLISISAHKKF
jgi:hypothetical protein